MALRFLKGIIQENGKVMIIFSGGGKQVWYPSLEEIDRISRCLHKIEQIKETTGDLEAELNKEI